MQRAERLERVVARLLALGVVVDAVGQRDGLARAARLVDLGDGLLELGHVRAQQPGAPARLDDGVGHLAAHAAAGAGDDGDLAGEIDAAHVVVISLMFVLALVFVFRA